MENYEKIRSVGRGAHGQVFLSKQKSDDKFVILKEIPVDQMSVEERQISLNEAKVLKMLDHPNIVAYYENFLDDKTMIIVMEFMQGGTLFDYLQEQNGIYLNEDEILNIFCQMLYTLQHVHGKSILHRDLKSQNILLNKKKNIVKIGDFGISKILSSKSKAYTVVGTPCYISPELCEGKPYNQKSDIWALGCILYELMTFKRPFDATTLPALVMKIMNGSFDPAPEMYSADLRDEILPKMLHLDPNQRPTAAQIMCHPRILKVVFKLYMTIGSIPYNKRSESTKEENVEFKLEKPVIKNESNILPESVSGPVNKNHSIWLFEENSATAICLPPLNSPIQSIALGLKDKIGLTESGLLVNWRKTPIILVNSELEESEQPSSFTASIIDKNVAINIAAVVCGNEFTVCLSENGVVFTFGKVSSGCLGFTSQKDVNQPRVVESLFNHHISSIACGPNHVLALSEENECFSWGYGKEGCLGLGDTEHQIFPQLVEIPVEFVPSKIVCGVNSSFIVTKDQCLLVCGSNRHNKLGLDYVEDQNEIDEVRTFKPIVSEPICNIKITSVASGVSHTVILTENGDVYSMGSNRFKQLGWGQTNLYHTMPHKIEMETNHISQIFCGDFFTLAMTQSGKLYCWGKCPKALTGEETDCVNVKTPFFLEQKHAFAVSCYSDNCAVILDDT